MAFLMSSPRERILAVMAGELPDHVPFSIWTDQIPDDAMLHALLEREACVTVKSEAYTMDHDGVRVEWESFVGPDGAERYRLTHHTPAGPLIVIQRPMPGTTWTETHPFTDPHDYDALECLIAARRYTPCPDRLLKDDARHPGQSIARPISLRSPMHGVINSLLGVEAFSIEWFDNRERIERLCSLLREDALKQVRILASSPGSYFIIDGNTQFDILGLDRYERYCMPYIEEACEILHTGGKLAGAHLDGNNAIAAHLIARTGLDFIESFTPPPDCDLPLAAARQTWPGKGLIINFPSAMHHSDADKIRLTMKELRREAGDCRGVAMGVIEDIPTNKHLLLLAEETRKWKASQGCT